MNIEKKEQLIKTTYENEHIGLKVQVLDGAISSMSFSRVDTGRHLFSLKQLENGGIKRACQLLLSTIEMLREAHTILLEFSNMSTLPSYKQNTVKKVTKKTRRAIKAL